MMSATNAATLDAELCLKRKDLDASTSDFRKKTAKSRISDFLKSPPPNTVPIVVDDDILLASRGPSPLLVPSPPKDPHRAVNAKRALSKQSDASQQPIRRKGAPLHELSPNVLPSPAKAATNHGAAPAAADAVSHSEAQPEHAPWSQVDESDLLLELAGVLDSADAVASDDFIVQALPTVSSQSPSQRASMLRRARTTGAAAAASLFDVAAPAPPSQRTVQPLQRAQTIAGAPAITATVDMEDLAGASSVAHVRRMPRAMMMRVVSVHMAAPGETVVMLEASAPTRSKQVEATAAPTSAPPAVSCSVRLRGSWSSTPVAVGMYANVLGAAGTDGSVVVDDERNLFVLQPDVLVSGTRVADSFRCLRRTVLDERIHSAGRSSGLQGQLSHELFERALRCDSVTVSLLEQEAASIVQERVEDLFGVGDSEQTAMQALREAIPNVIEWRRKYMNPATPRQDRAVVSDGGSGPNMSAVRVLQILGAEESIWSPALGLKGVVDVPVEVSVEPLNGVGAVQTVTMPLELKTGRPNGAMYSIAHRAQLILYILLMSERFEMDVTEGVLCYLRSGRMFRVAATWSEVRGLVMGRNELAVSLAPASPLPPVLRSRDECLRCSQLNVCMTLHRVLEGGSGVSSDLHADFDSITRHLTPAHAAYVQRWLSLIDLEYAMAIRQRQELWTRTADERQRSGRCLAHMELVLHGASQRGGHEYSFRRTAASVANVLESAFGVGDSVLCTPQGGPLTITTGVVRGLTAESVVVEFTSELRVPASARDCRWSLDKNEVLSGFNISRENILQLVAQTDRGLRLRDLLVELQPPRFEKRIDIDTQKFGLNEDQRKALHRVLSANDYALILGMPGTGKTTTIARLVAALVSAGRTVLLTSFTHTALDTILLKLVALNVDFLRLGRPAQVHPDILPYTLHKDRAGLTVDRLNGLLHAPLVATTCLSVSHALISKRRFDVCIVDEAGQLTEPVCLGPLRQADSFVLVGDHNQLQPVVKSREAREGGMSQSLFSRLCDAHPAAVCRLSFQYRMAADIMLVANTLVYNHALQCCDPQVATAKLALPQIDRVSSTLPSWLLSLLDPERRVVFANTDSIPALETRVGDGVCNEVEGTIVCQVVDALVRSGVAAGDIGVIAPYRAQLQLLLHRIQHAAVDVYTVDRYQGRDKDCIIVSLVRSNDMRMVGELLSDWRRLNVAFTRARKKLIVVGSGDTLQGSPICASFLELVWSQGWISA